MKIHSSSLKTITAAGLLIFFVGVGLRQAVSEVPPQYKHLVEKYKTLCDVDQDLCGKFERLRSRQEAVSASGTKLTTAEAIELNKSCDAMNDRYLLVLRDRSEYELKNGIPGYAMDAIHQIADQPLHTLSVKIKTLSLSVVPLNIADLSASMGHLEKRLTDLERDTGETLKQNGVKTPLIESLKSLYEDGNKLWIHLKDNTLIIKDSGNPVESQPGGAFKKLTPSGELITHSINPINARLDEFSRRLNALDASLGAGQARNYIGHELKSAGHASGAAQRLEKGGLLSNPFDEKTGENADEGNVENGGGDSSDSNAQPDPTQTKPNLKFRSFAVTPPAPEPRQISRWEQIQATLTGARVPLEVGDPKMHRYPEETLKVERLKARGMTLTYGAPQRRAAYTFPQEGGTCAISAQAQIIAEAKGIPPTKMKELENSLFQRASQANCFTQNKFIDNQRSLGGTTDQCLSQMLEDSGMLTRKRFGSSQEELEGALKGGRMLMITAKAGYLWNEVEEYKGGHAVVVTGSEFHKDGGLLGVYINDTGVRPPHGGRFINAKQFIEAWKSWGSTYVEPL